MKLQHLLIPAALAACLVAQQGPPQGAPQGAPPVTEVKAYLSLTDSQITSLTQLRQQEGETIRTEQQQIQTKATELRSAVDKNDAAAAGKIVLEIAAIRKRIDDIHTRYQAQAVAVLTDAQKTKLKTLEDASKLMPTVGQAGALGLLTPPQPPANAVGVGAGPRGGMGPGGMGGPGMGGFGPMGFRARPF